MPENDSKQIATDLRTLANNFLHDPHAVTLIREYADQLDPQPVTLTLTARQLEILRAVVDGGNQHSMTNRAAHSNNYEVGVITSDDYADLWDVLSAG